MITIKNHLYIMYSIIVLFLLLIIPALYSASSQRTSIAMIVSVSSDGKYVVSSHLNGEIILWNLSHHTHQLIATQANIYSAYFIKHSYWFMWQDQHNKVHVQDINGISIIQFQNKFPVYGQVMSNDLKRYFVSD